MTSNLSDQVFPQTTESMAMNTKNIVPVPKVVVKKETPKSTLTQQQTKAVQKMNDP